ncbi:olfactory receptor 14J1-like, partial [Columba livia]|uniref:olfactory receptor 14J1-like n=1 Tax=Columba livia TaxID=8932 RepID=UPI0031B9EBCE
LHYGTLLGSRACVHMAAAAWATGFLHALLHTANTFSLPLCKGNALDQFFCEIPQILKLSCSHSYLREIRLIVISVLLIFGCFVFIVVSYVQIFRAVLRIPSEQGRHKAFSTCLPHLAVVSLFLSTLMFAHLKPPSISSPSLDLVVSVLYSVVPPVEQGCEDGVGKRLCQTVSGVLFWHHAVKHESAVENSGTGEVRGPGGEGLLPVCTGVKSSNAFTGCPCEWEEENWL